MGYTHININLEILMWISVVVLESILCEVIYLLNIAHW